MSVCHSPDIATASLCSLYKAVASSLSPQGCSAACNMDLRRDKPRQLINFFILCSSELWIWKSCVAAIPPLRLPPVPPPQLHGSPGRGDGWNHPWCHHPEKLWAETPRSDFMVDLPFYLCHFCLVCHLLEYFCLQSVGSKATSPSLKTWDRNWRAEVIYQLC